MESLEFAILNWIQVHLRCGFLDAVLPAVSWTANHGELWIILAAVLLSLSLINLYKGLCIRVVRVSSKGEE